MGAKRIEFKVVYATSEQSKSPAFELDSNKHGPLVHGWKSEKLNSV